MTKASDPLRELRRSVALQQGVSRAGSVSNSNLVDYLTSNINWSQLLPLIIPLVMQILRRRQTAQSPRPNASGGATAPTQGLGGILGTLLGGQTQPQAQQQSSQADPMAGILGTLLSGQSQPQTQQQSPQADPLAGILGTFLGGQTQPQAQQQSSQADPLAGILGTLLGGQAQPQAQQQSPQADPLGGLLGTLLGGGGGQATQQQAQQPDVLGTLLQLFTGGRAQQAGGLLGVLGAQPQPQRGVNSLLDTVASSVDLDGDGVPDALQKMLGGRVEDDTQKRGAATLLEHVLSQASPQDLKSFSRSVQELLPGMQQA